MKNSFILLLIIFMVGNSAYAQTNINSLFAAMNAAPINREACIYDLHYKKVRSDSTSIICQNNLDLHPLALEKLELFGQAIDDAELINYKRDTVYIFSTFYVTDLSSDNTIKTSKGVYKVNLNMKEEYVISTIEDYYKRTSKYLDGPEYWGSKRLIYETIFTWDIKKLINIINSSGKTVDNNTATAVRIIINDYKVLEIDVINFDDAQRWRFAN